MLKILLSLIILITIANSAEMGIHGGGCLLTQKGEFKVGVDNFTLNNAKYIPIAKSGGNFRSIFVGSKVLITNPDTKEIIEATIINYKPNKRIRGKPKTGLFIVEINMNNITKIVEMDYIFKDGVMKADSTLNSSVLKDVSDLKSLKIWFETDVNYSMCYTKK